MKKASVEAVGRYSRTHCKDIRAAGLLRPSIPDVESMKEIK